MKCKCILTPIMAMALAVLTTSAFAGPAPRPTPAPALDAPTLRCNGSTQTTISVNVCAGLSGAPAGFSLQWMTLADYVANGNQWPSNASNLCKLSASGVPGCSVYNLPSLGCAPISVGDIDVGQCGISVENCGGEPLVCGTQYVFRAFAHNDPATGRNRSAFSATITCETTACEQSCVPGCTFTQGYWQNHGPGACQQGNNCDVWCVNELTLGTVSYTKDQLCAIMHEPVAGNGLIQLAGQLIAAKLNIACAGADSTAIASTIAAADALIGGLMVPPTGTGFLSPSSTSGLIAALDAFNQGVFPGGPSHCVDALPCP